MGAALPWKEAPLKLLRWLLMTLYLAGVACAQQSVLPLYTGVAPGSEGKTAAEQVRMSEQGDHVYSQVHHPSITVYLPPAGTGNGAGVLVIPGGGHKEIWIDHEGFRVAEYLSRHGIAAFVLKYRLAREPGSTYTVEGTELDDAKAAMRLIRSHAGAWKIDGARVGVLGFSAGGELAALLSTRAGDAERPAFEGLLYPAIPAQMTLSRGDPPAFLACGANDEARIAEAVPALYLRMKQAGIPDEMHIFAGVGHGFGIRPNNAANVGDWPELFERWLASAGFLKP